jgi:murein DD-endopeptidase MepM/ murein hydrolase activator NlpD
MTLAAPGRVVAALFLLLPACSGTATNPSQSTATRQREYEACLAREVFGASTASPYVLPFPVGSTYRVSATCCDTANEHYNELAYDFEMPIGADVAAMRAGIVEAVVDHFSDAVLDYTQSNYLAIRHDDGTVAGYGHTQQGGAVVHVGDRVAQGQIITHAGSSGTAGFPHLHVGVFPSVVWRRTDDLAFNLRNAEGPVDQRGALIVGASYKALPYQTLASNLSR